MIDIDYLEKIAKKNNEEVIRWMAAFESSDIPYPYKGVKKPLEFELTRTTPSAAEWIPEGEAVTCYSRKGVGILVDPEAVYKKFPYDAWSVYNKKGDLISTKTSDEVAKPGDFNYHGREAWVCPREGYIKALIIQKPFNQLSNKVQKDLNYISSKYNLPIEERLYNKPEYKKMYDPPMSLEDIKKNYSEELYTKLKNDPVHNWRATTGIELIHKEPSYQEQIRTYQNWENMPKNLKTLSNKKSMELFGVDNKKHFKQLLKEWNNK